MNLLAAFRKMDCDEADLDLVLSYIRCQAPILIHVHMDRYIDQFLSSTHYKNLFETGHGSGTTCKRSRAQWEDRLFHSLYNDAQPSERVKYGVLNVSSDPAGVKSCLQYGESYFLLKSENVRLRTTFADSDTGSSHGAALGMCEHYAHVLEKFPLEELAHLLTIAKSHQALPTMTSKLRADSHGPAAGAGRATTSKKGASAPSVPWVPSNKFSNYREAQVHGLVSFASDIEALSIAARHKSSPDLCAKIEDFCTKNSINFWYQDVEKGSEMPAGRGKTWGGAGGYF